VDSLVCLITRESQPNVRFKSATFGAGLVLANRLVAEGLAVDGHHDICPPALALATGLKIVNSKPYCAGPAPSGWL
jgi:hypothetical protein